MTYKRYLLYKAYRYWRMGLLLPFDLATELSEHGVIVEELEDSFMSGIDPEEMGED